MLNIHKKKAMVSLNATSRKGFTFVELVVVIAVLAVLLAVLAPSLLSYVELSRMQKDDSTMDEVVNAVQLAITDSATFDEVYSYCIPNNYVTYTDSSGKYANRTMDEEFWAPDGSGAAVTITFNPENGKYNISGGIVNDMTFGNGSVAEKRTAEGVQQCYLYEMGKSLLYSSVKQTIGNSVKERSATYKNSSYTVFVRFKIVDGTRQADVYGLFNGTNLSEGCPAAIGSNTSSYDEENKPISTTPSGGHQNSKFTNTDLTGGGSLGGFGPNKPLPTYRQCKNGHTFDETNPVLAERCVCTVCYVTEHKLFETGFIKRCERCTLYVEPHKCNGNPCSLCGSILITKQNREQFGWTEETTSFVFPETFLYTDGKEYWVTGTDVNTFYGCKTLTGVTFSNWVTTIGYASFQSTGLTSITIPESVTTIRAMAFTQCLRLTSVTYKGTIKQWNSLSKGSSWLKNAATSIVHCKDGCINFATGYTTSCAVHGTIDDGFAVFSDGTKLTGSQIRMPENQEKYGYSVGEFNDTIPFRAFERNKYLTQIKLPDNTTTISQNAFYGCSALTSAVLPDGLKTIGYASFQSANISTITIPKSVQSIDGMAFTQCLKLTSVTYDGTIKQWNSLSKGSSWLNNSATSIVHCINGCIDSKTGNKAICAVHDSVDDGFAIFSDGTRLTGVELRLSENQIKYGYSIGQFNDVIPYRAFHRNLYITEIQLPNNITAISQNAFYGCSALTNAVLPDGLKTIGYASFQSTNISTITIPKSVQSIDGMAFTQCLKLTSVTYEGTVEQWNTISKSPSWLENSATEIIHCSDGCVHWQTGELISCPQHP